MADSRNRGEGNMSVSNDSSVASPHLGNCLITYSDFTTFLDRCACDPFCFSSDKIYRDFVRFSLNPNVVIVSPYQIIRDVSKIVGEHKLVLIDDFAKLSNKVAISADILCDYWHRFHFISITCHSIDHTFEFPLQKKLIACREFDVEHTAANISSMIHKVLREYDLVERTCSISFDNVIADKTSLETLAQFCQSSISCKFFHNRCINHVLSLCVQDALISLKDHITPIRAAISRLTRNISLTDEWIIFCKNHDLKHKKFLLDKPDRWNSTYKMLNGSFQYREALCSFFEQQRCGIVLFPSQWDHCTNLCVLLNFFKEAISELSYVYYPTSWLVVDHCVKIACLLNYFSSCAYLGDCIAKMKEKWLKYFSRIPDVFLIAKVLDPRVRLDGLENMLTRYYDALFPIKNDDTPRPNEVASNTKQLLFNIFGEYMINIDKSKDTTTSSGRQDQVGLIGSRPGFPLFQDIEDFLTSRKKPMHSSRPPGSKAYDEFEEYLTTSFDNSYFDKSFDILTWWSQSTRRFPTLSLIANEILACPASTLSMEQAFSVKDSTLNARQSTLAVEDLENQCLLEDWISAEARSQDCNLDTDDEGDVYDDVHVTRL